MNRLGELFNQYAAAIQDVSGPCGEEIDVTVSVRVRLFGDSGRKNEAWRREHAEPQEISWMSVSSSPVEVWGDLRREKGTAKLLINTLALGHEFQHALRIALSEWTLRSEDPAEDGCDVLSPDYYTEL
ncbi:MAG: hypothetical protein WC373_12110 [Smithella sp.]|jgi:hypothetical protein